MPVNNLKPGLLITVFIGLLSFSNISPAPPNKPGPEIDFRNPVNPDFGTLQGGPAGRTFILTTSGTVTGTNAGDYVYGAFAGRIEINAGNNSTIEILATNMIDDGGVRIVNVTCKYHNMPDMDCDSGFTAEGRRSGRIMDIGLEIVTTQVHGENDVASPSFDIVVNYL